ncbi:MAG: hypothetical protein ThorAB25_06670 [Candidatus Thorarchaeota archaeon AB_25]|nr:MAG: hypothetical protein ThorAB25_06670 [Candidatus Thorarchaeota archaeon AB_25]
MLLDWIMWSQSLHFNLRTVFLVVFANLFWIGFGNDPYPRVFLAIRRSPSAIRRLFPGFPIETPCTVYFLHRGQYLFSSLFIFIGSHQS